MTNDDKIINHKLQYNINREAAKILALFSGGKKINMIILQLKKC